MALRLVEGFENVDNSYLMAKYVSPGGSFVPGRLGGSALSIGGGNSHVRYILSDAPQTIGTGFAFRSSDVTGGVIAFLFDSGLNGQIGLYKTANQGLAIWVNGSFPAASAGFLTFNNAWCYIEWEVYVHPTNGTSKVWLNGALVIDYTGNTRTSGNSNIQAVQLQRDASTQDWDDWYVYDTNAGAITTHQGDCVVYGVLPNAAGTYAEWTPSAGANYECVDETPPNGDTDYVSSGTVGQKDSYVFTDLPVFSGAIKGLTVTTFARKDDAGSRAFAVLTKSGATEVDGATRNINATYQGWYETYETDPNTGAEWTRANFNAAEFGAKVIA